MKESRGIIWKDEAGRSKGKNQDERRSRRKAEERGQREDERRKRRKEVGEGLRRE